MRLFSGRADDTFTNASNARLWPLGDVAPEAERTAAMCLSSQSLDFGASFGYKINYGAF